MIVGLYPNPDLFYPNLVYPKLWAFEHGFPMFFFIPQQHQQDMLMLVMVDTDMDDVVTAVVAEGHFINQQLSFPKDPEVTPKIGGEELHEAP